MPRILQRFERFSQPTSSIEDDTPSSTPSNALVELEDCHMSLWRRSSTVFRQSPYLPPR